jgi:hypothetical protein
MVKGHIRTHGDARDATLKPPVEEGGEVEKACQGCRTLWPEDALDPQSGLCPDCREDDGA